MSNEYFRVIVLGKNNDQIVDETQRIIVSEYELSDILVELDGCLILRAMRMAERRPLPKVQSENDGLGWPGRNARVTMVL